MLEEKPRSAAARLPALLTYGSITIRRSTTRLIGSDSSWADRNNLLHRVQMFFDTMPASASERLD